MSTCYIPVHSLLREDCEAVHKKYETKKVIGRGAYGQAFVACDRETGDCDYVLKVIKHDHELSGYRGVFREDIADAWLNEVDIMLRLNKKQQKAKMKFSPILYDAWYCDVGDDTYFYILMERYDGSLKDLLSSPSEYKFISSSLELMDSYLYIIHRECRICLNDIKLDNILFKKISDTHYKCVFADFGKATRESDRECTKTDREAFQRTIERIRAYIS